MNGDQEQGNTVRAADVKVRLSLFFTIVFGMGSSTAWGAWEGRRGNLLDGNLTIEHQLYLVLILSTVHVRLFNGKSRSRWKIGSEERFFAKVQSGQKFILAFHHACALELCNF